MKENTSPLMVTISCLAYNHEHYIRQCLEGFVMQKTNFRFEAIVHDDASTDASVEVVARAIADDPRFRIICKSRPIGGSAARDVGFRQSHGKYVMFLDSDDLLSPDCLINRVRTFQEPRYVDCDWLVFPMGTFKTVPGDLPGVWRPSSEANHLRDILMHKIPWAVMQPLWRRSVLEYLCDECGIGPFNPIYPRLQDVEMHTRALLMVKAKYAVVSDGAPDCFYRIDDRRSGDNWTALLTRQINGVRLYLNEISRLLEGRRDERRCRNALRGTLIAGLRALFYRWSQKDIGTAYLTQQCKALVESANSAGILSLKAKGLLGVYLFCSRRLHLQRVKGVNWLMTKCLLSLD